MQRYWDEVEVGEHLQPIDFPLSVYRLVVAAGANRDFNSIHHNSEFAKASGAPEMYANAMLLQGMWERLVRQFIGNKGQIRSLRGFRMNSFCCAGSTVTASGEVTRKWIENDDGLIEISLRSHVGRRLAVGPGSIIATIPNTAIGQLP
ncbi:hypothetical protein [Altererythrobacter sp. Z27]|uniref:hypothetical protein n=1 Tax=Altererythrobacter sp. Z27 TaxID=3461147 RepID=UPI0040445C45